MDNLVSFQIKAVPLPSEVTEFLKTNQESIKRIIDGKQTASSQSQLEPSIFWERLQDLLAKGGDQWSTTVQNLRAFGPRGSGPNLLIDSSHSGFKPYVDNFIASEL